jgi:hypothetical protein
MSIYDCFLFFNELDLLDIRFNELDQHVDFFVLAESEETFQGVPKPLFFKENRERFSRFLNKIIYLTIPRKGNVTTWDRQHFQRKYLGHGLKEAQPEDLIIISDLDEIPRGNTIGSNLPKDGEVTEFIMRAYSHFLNRRLLRRDPKFERFGGQNFNGSIMIRFSNFTNAEDVRRLQGEYSQYRSQGRILQVNEGGWHLSWMGDFSHISYKAESVSGSTALNVAHRNETAWKTQIDQIRSGSKLTGYLPDKKVEYILEDINKNTHPKYIIDNIEKFSSWIYHDKK